MRNDTENKTTALFGYFHRDLRPNKRTNERPHERAPARASERPHERTNERAPALLEDVNLSC